MTIAAIIVIGVLAFLVYRDCKNAPEMWDCPNCNTEVIGDMCSYCGTKKEE